MTEEERIEKILRTALPVECNLVGDANLQMVIERRHDKGPPNIERIEGGSDLSIETALTILLPSASIALQLLQLYFDWCASKPFDAVAVKTENSTTNVDIENQWIMVVNNYVDGEGVAIEHDVKLDLAEGVKRVGDEVTKGT